MSDNKVLIVGFTEADLADEGVAPVDGSKPAGKCAECGREVTIGPGSWKQMEGVPQKRLRLLCFKDYRQLEGHPE